MTGWVDQLGELSDGAEAVLVTVANADGSTPREAGTKMVVTAEGFTGSVGGGHLEYKALEMARDILAGGGAPLLHEFPLGPALGQCCGGWASLVFERVTAAAAGWLAPLVERLAAGAGVVVATSLATGQKMVVWEDGAAGTLGGDADDKQVQNLVRRQGLDSFQAGPAVVNETLSPVRMKDARLLLEAVRPVDFDIYLFGAGHVGRALVSVLAGLDCRLTWVDGRAGQFPEEVPDTVTVEAGPDPGAAIERAPHHAYFLVMTHSHQLDFELCEKILKRGDFAYLGLIGSATKRKRFEKRFLDGGFAPGALTRLTCPIGVAGVPGKHPREIAIAVAAELLQRRAASDGDAVTAGKALSA